MRFRGVVVILLVMSGCTGYPAVPPKPPVVETPEIPRYRIEYRDRGTLVLPGFAVVERDGEFVLVPDEIQKGEML